MGWELQIKERLESARSTGSMKTGSLVPAGCPGLEQSPALSQQLLSI